MNQERLVSFTYGMAVWLFLAILLCLGVSTRMFYWIGPGELGVLYRFISGTELTRTYSEGLNIIFPANRMYIYDTRVQEISRKVYVLSFNGLSVEVTVSCRYRPIKDELPQLHQEIGPDYEQKAVIPILLAAVREVVGNYRPEELYTTHSSTIQAEINRVAHEGIADQHVTFLPILVESISLPQTVNQAIEAKLRQQQEAQSYEFRLQRESQEKERKRLEAEGIQGYHRLVSEQLSPPLLKWLEIEAMKALSLSNNSKVVIMGQSSSTPVSLPLFLTEPAPAATPRPATDSGQAKADPLPARAASQKPSPTSSDTDLPAVQSDAGNPRTSIQQSRASASSQGVAGKQTAGGGDSAPTDRGVPR